MNELPGIVPYPSVQVLLATFASIPAGTVSKVLICILSTNVLNAILKPCTIHSAFSDGAWSCSLSCLLLHVCTVHALMYPSTPYCCWHRHCDPHTDASLNLLECKHMFAQWTCTSIAWQFIKTSIALPPECRCNMRQEGTSLTAAERW